MPSSKESGTFEYLNSQRLELNPSLTLSLVLFQIRMLCRVTTSTFFAFVTVVAARYYDYNHYYTNQPNTADQEPVIENDALSWLLDLMESVSYDSPYGNTTYDNGTSTEMPTQGPQPYGVYPHHQSPEYYYDHGSGQYPHDQPQYGEYNYDHGSGQYPHYQPQYGEYYYDHESGQVTLYEAQKQGDYPYQHNPASSGAPMSTVSHNGLHGNVANPWMSKMYVLNEEAAKNYYRTATSPTYTTTATSSPYTITATSPPYTTTATSPVYTITATPPYATTATSPHYTATALLQTRLLPLLQLTRLLPLLHLTRQLLLRQKAVKVFSFITVFSYRSDRQAKEAPTSAAQYIKVSTIISSSATPFSNLFYSISGPEFGDPMGYKECMIHILLACNNKLYLQAV
ncbi:hypothetical protein KIN20_013045 [Parelaphostrongylus tenuis]|uniref:Uncharacterized protein n=1 Tax=Parelaphostrongylus tenuis TaxID=148309 RepID=A0AAD5QMC7_PARTN|nr:hypothetical protein KIN20_013045 [Parelaphostrongylus tenuis]